MSTRSAKLPKRPSSQIAPGRPEARPKIQNVASLADVSLATVSAVLNCKGRISEATRQRVRQAMAELGYRPDLYASNLARRKTSLLGVIVSNLQNLFFAETAQAIEEEAARAGFQISLMATNFSPLQQRAAVQTLLSARVAGLAIMTSEYDAEAYHLAVNSRVPTVSLDTGRPSDTSAVLRVDSRNGMRSVVEHLLELGHRQILFVRNSQALGARPLLSHHLRDQGFAAAVRHFPPRDLTVTIIDAVGSGAEAGEAAIAAVSGNVSFTAVVAITDMIALGVYRALQSRGLRIPHDVSVVGFDNTSFGRFLNPPLTTVDVPRSELGRLTVASLIDGALGRTLRLATSLVVRESTSPPFGRI